MKERLTRSAPPDGFVLSRGALKLACRGPDAPAAEIGDGRVGVAQDGGDFESVVQRQGDGGFLHRRCSDAAGVKQFAVHGSDNHRYVGVGSVLTLGGVYVHHHRVTGVSLPALSLLRPVSFCCASGGCCVVATGPRGVSRCLFRSPSTAGPRLDRTRLWADAGRLFGGFLCRQPSPIETRPSSARRLEETS
ncbi:hypothetical protein MRX96_008505 [Rhipicephalus microplus]